MMTVRRRDLPKLHDPISVQAELDRVKRANELAVSLIAAATESVGEKHHWYVLAVKNRREKSVVDALEEKNICAWVPMKPGVRRRYRRRILPGRPEPIFCGYVFVHMAMNSAAHGILKSDSDVDGVLGDDGKPFPIDDELFLCLKDLVLAGVFCEAPRDMGAKTAQEMFDEGDQVEITKGPATMMKAVVDGYRGTRHVRCMANIFGRSTPMVVGIDNLKKIG